MAQRGVNKVVLLGNVGDDPTLRYSPQGTAFCSLSVATSESWNDKQTGEKKEQTEWHRVSLVGKLAEIAGQYVKKGDQIYFEGQLRTRKWVDQAGVEKYTTEVYVGINGTMQLLNNGHHGDQDQQRQPQQQQQQRQPQQQQQQQRQQQGGNGGYANRNQRQYPQDNQQYGQPNGNQNAHNGAGNIYDDDIPFAPVGLMYPDTALYVL